MKTASFSLASLAMGSGARMKKYIERAHELAPSTSPEVSQALVRAEQSLEFAQEQLLVAMNSLKDHDAKGPKVEA